MDEATTFIKFYIASAICIYWWVWVQLARKWASEEDGDNRTI